MFFRHRYSQSSELLPFTVAVENRTKEYGENRVTNDGRVGHAVLFAKPTMRQAIV